VYGLSTNSLYEGAAMVGGASIGADAFGYVGYSRSTSLAVANGKEFPPNIVVDPVSNSLIRSNQHNITIGANLMGNGIDGGVFAGGAFTQLQRNFPLYWWQK
jgi:hypothetical protein